MPLSFQASQVRDQDNPISLKKEGELFNLTEDIVDGYLVTQQISHGLYLIQSEMSFAQDTVFREEYSEKDLLLLSFCLDGDWEWNYRKKGLDSYRLSPTQCSIQHGAVHQCEDYYQAGQTYRSLSISLDKTRFSSFTDCLESAHLLQSDHESCTQIFSSTPSIRRILQQLSDCPPDQKLKLLYLEGKTLELLSTFCHEIVDQKKDNLFLSKGDCQCLIEARTFIDRYFNQTLTIPQIAQACFLSETKLKKAFKSCFGCTIYEYIVEKRMELAYTLLQNGKYKVKDVVWMVGYSNASHFIDQFRKHYGVTPGGI